MLKLLDTYRSILRFSGCKEIDGFIYSDIPGEVELNLLKIHDKPWVIPTDANLRDAYQKGYAVFHPLNENIVKGESSDIKKLKNCINVHLNIVLFTLLESLLNIVADSKLHKKLNPEQSELCVILKKVKESQILEFKKTILAGTAKPEMNGIVYISLKRGGTLNGKRYARTGNVSFPFYEKLKEGTPFNLQEIMDDGTVKSVPNKEFSPADTDLLVKLLEYVFPEIETLNSYSFGSNANTAPYLEALLKAAYNVIYRVMDVHAIFEDFVPNPELYEFDLDWLEPFKNLNEYEKEIRTVQVTQTSNDSITDGNSNSMGGFSMPAFSAPQQVALTTTSNGGIDPSSLSRSIMQRNMNMQLQNPYGYQPQQHQQPYIGGGVYNQQATTNNYNSAYGYQTQQNNLPSWARPNVPQPQVNQNLYMNPNMGYNQYNQAGFVNPNMQQMAYGQQQPTMTGQRMTLANTRAAY